VLFDPSTEFRVGGELFDHILAHRYLKEADAAKLFAQLVSGVHYLHQKSIVHRDLKLENLLLDKHRNIIITDFGFANRFSNRQDDLMATSCGSPCYAAPELVISEGAYAGTAADIWSCGVILYAMLSGYLPFDDDPANPDGDNINLLYRYIVATPLTFPQQLSAEARDLLSKMLVADPEKRCGMREVLSHPWLGEHIEFLSSTCLDLEAIALQSRMHTRRMHRSLGQAVTRKKDPDLRDPVPTKILDTPQAGAQAMEAPFTDDLPSAKPIESVGGRHSSYVTSSQLGPSFDTPEDGQSRTQAAGAIEPNALEVDCNGGSRKKNHSEAGADFESRSPAQDSNAASNVRPAFPVRQNRHTIQLEYDEASVIDTLCRQQIPSKVVSGRQLSESASASQSGNSFRSTALQDTRDPRQRVACTSNLSATSKPLDSNSETALVLPDSTGTAKDVVISPKTFVDNSEFTETKLSPPPDPVRPLSFER
jgi:protein-serine/threonine kinase